MGTKKKTALVVAPQWDAGHPPLPLAMLSAALREKGYPVQVCDLNKKFGLRHPEFSRQVSNSLCTYSCDLHTVMQELTRRHPKILEQEADKLLEMDADVYGFTIYTTTEFFSLELARRIKRQDKSKIVIFGGPECLHSAERFMEDPAIDYVAIGESEELLPELLGHISLKTDPAACRGIWYRKEGVPVYTGERPFIRDLDALPFPDFSGMLGPYADTPGFMLPMQGSRGCINRCSFCAESRYGKKYRTKSAERIFAEMIRAGIDYGTTDFFFHDSAVNGDTNVLEQLCDLLIDHRTKILLDNSRKSSKAKPSGEIHWLGQLFVRPQLTPQLLRKMKAAGCDAIRYGIESWSDNVLASMKKPYNSRRAARVVKETAAAGIECHLNMIIGYPSETESDFKKTLQFTERLHACITSMRLSLCVPARNSPLHWDADKWGITGKDSVLFWESDKGKNNFLVRFDRYERICGLADRLGISWGRKKADILREKPDLLAAYEQYLNSRPTGGD